MFLSVSIKLTLDLLSVLSHHSTSPVLSGFELSLLSTYPSLPSSTTKTVTGNILINPTTWAGTGLNVTFLNNGTNYVAFITNYSGSTITKDGIKITVMAKQTI